MNFPGSQQYLRHFISIREKVVIVLFFQNKFYNAVFIFRFLTNLQSQNVTNVTVTHVTNFSVESFLTIPLKPLDVFFKILQNSIIFSKLTVKYSLQNNSLRTSQHPCLWHTFQFVFYWYVMKFRLHLYWKRWDNLWG